MKIIFFFTLILLMGATMMEVEADNCVCPLNYLPVCGSDGKTYGNQCSLQCARVRMSHRGACKK